MRLAQSIANSADRKDRMLKATFHYKEVIDAVVTSRSGRRVDGTTDQIEPPDVVLPIFRTIRIYRNRKTMSMSAINISK